jgi:hypothetical protein
MKPDKVNIGRKKISSEEIASKRNFDEILKAHKAAKPFHKSYWFMGLAGLAGLALIIGIVATYRTEEKPALNVKEENAQLGKPDSVSKFVNPPMKDVQIPFERFLIDSRKSAVISSASGSKIIVPANSFVDMLGKAVEGKVEVKYREFRDPVDFFLSGIPMAYDSAGNRYQLESAGMLEITANQNGIPVRIASDKKIEIQMASDYEGSQYNLYELDTVGRNWVYKGKDKIEKTDKVKMPKLVDGTLRSAEYTIKSFGLRIGEIKYVDSPFPNLVLRQSFGRGTLIPKNTKIDLEVGNGKNNRDSVYLYPGMDPEFEEEKSKEANIRKEIFSIEKTKPVKPVKAKSERYRFNVDVDPKEFPEMYEYKNLLFEVGPENRTFNQSLYNIEWDDVVMSYGNPGVNYNLAFTKDGKTKSFTVYPVYEGKDSAGVMNIYKKKFQDYETKLKGRKEEEKRIQQENARKLEEWKREQKRRQDEWDNQQKAWKQKDEAWMKSNAALGTASVIRIFSISNFGIYNSDTPVQYKDRVVVAADFTSGKNPYYGDVFHVDKSRNTLLKIYNYQGNNPKVSYSRSSRNVLFVVLDGGTIASFDEKDFASVSKGVSKYNFMLKEAEQKFQTPEEVKKFLLADVL